MDSKEQPIKRRIKYDSTGVPIIPDTSLFDYLLDPTRDMDRPIGCVPMFPNQRVLDLLEDKTRRKARNDLHVQIKCGVIKYSRVEEAGKVVEVRNKILATLGKLREDKSEFAIQPLINGYHAVVAKITSQFADDYQASLPAEVCQALRKGKIKTIEDFEMALERCLVRGDSSHTDWVERFRKTLECANTLLFEECRLMKSGEDVTVAQNRFKTCRNQAVHFLTQLCHDAVDYQRRHAPKRIIRKRKKAGIPIRRFDIASGIAPKDEFQSLEVVAYEGEYPIGYQRPHWAQMTLVFTLLFNIINEHPSFIHRVDAIRKLNDLLNPHLRGRAAVDGPSFWTDKAGNIKMRRPTKHKRKWSKVEGYPQYQLKSLSVEGAKGPTTLFVDGLYVTIHNRPKSAESLVTKYFNRGSLDLKHIRDWGGFEVLIDPRDLKKQFEKRFGHTPSKKELRKYAIQVVADTKLYFMTIWGIKPKDIIPRSDKPELTEYLKDPNKFKKRKVRQGNSASSARFVTDKISFNCTVQDPANMRDVIVPIELQVTLTPFKARFDSPDDEASHHRYVLRRRMEGLLLAYVLDPVFRDVA